MNSFKQGLHREVEVECFGGNKGEVEDVGNPFGRDSPQDGPSKDRIDVLFRDDYLAGFQCGNDLMFETIDEIRRVKKAEGDGVEKVLLLEVRDRSTNKFDGVACRDDDADPLAR